MKNLKLAIIIFILIFQSYSFSENIDPVKKCEDEIKNNPEFKDKRTGNLLDGIPAKIQECKDKIQNACQSYIKEFDTNYTSASAACTKSAMGNVDSKCLVSSAATCTNAQEKLAAIKDEMLENMDDDGLKQIKNLASNTKPELTNILTDIFKESNNEYQKEMQEVASSCPSQTRKEWKEEYDKLNKDLLAAKEKIQDENENFRKDYTDLEESRTKKTQEYTTLQEDMNKQLKEKKAADKEQIDQIKEKVKGIQKKIEDNTSQIASAQNALDQIPLRRADIILKANTTCNQLLETYLADAKKNSNNTFKGYSSGLQVAAQKGNNLRTTLRTLFNRCQAETQLKKSSALKQLLAEEKDMQGNVTSLNSAITQLYNELTDANNEYSTVIQDQEKESKQNSQTLLNNINRVTEELKTINQNRSTIQTLHNQKLETLNAEVTRLQTNLDSLPEPAQGVTESYSTTVDAVTKLILSAKNLQNSKENCCSIPENKATCDKSSGIVKTNDNATKTEDSGSSSKNGKSKAVKDE